MKILKIFVLFLLSFIITVLLIHLESKQFEDVKTTINDNIPTIIWYQIGKQPNDIDIVLNDINKYIYNKLKINLKLKYIDFGEYNDRMNTIINSGENYDLAFTSSWSNSYLQNAQKGNFIPLDGLIEKYGKQMIGQIDYRFWEGVKINGRIYGIPTQKEISLMPMWVFTKEYIDKYNIPYKDLHSLEQLEPWLKLIKENEEGVVPLYINSDYSVPNNFDQIVDAVGILYNDTDLNVKNIYETEEVIKNLNIMADYYQKGYINKDAALTTSNSDIKRFIFKADGQPYAENIWSKDLGYEVVASNISDPIITNTSIRGAITAISKTSKNPETAIKLLNLVNTDKYLINLLNYGIENIHYKKLDNNAIKLLDNSINYKVTYFAQGNLFNSYVLEGEPETKWDEFKKFNDSSKTSIALGFNFNTINVGNELSNAKAVLDTFGAALNTGTVDPQIFLPKLNEELKKAGIEKIINEIQIQIDNSI